ncbi:MAG: DCC1-like thiol-disulfide oxidoreductase family protein [Verrucomicrobiota bacterium]
MKRLTVLYDGECGLCSRLKERLSAEPIWIQLEFLALQHPTVLERFPGVMAYEPSRRLVVISDSGGVYCGADAWIMVLYATRAFRELSMHLSDPLLKPLAKQVCEFVSQNRFAISELNGLKMERDWV